jgi:hypothetical protein
MFSPIGKDKHVGNIDDVKFSFPHQSVQRQSYPVGIIDRMGPREQSP